MPNKLLVVKVERNHQVEPEHALWIDLGAATLEGEALATTRVELNSLVPMEYGDWGSSVTSEINVTRSSTDVEGEILSFIDENFEDSEMAAVISHELWFVRLILGRRLPQVLELLEPRFIDIDVYFRAEIRRRLDSGASSSEGVCDTVAEVVQGFLFYQELFRLFSMPRVGADVFTALALDESIPVNN